MSIRIKLALIFLAIAIIPILIIGFISFSVARNALIDARLAALENIADIKVDKIESFFFERRGDIRTAQDYYNIKTNLPIVTQFANDRTNPAYITAKRALDSQLKTFKKVSGYVDVTLINPEGKVVYVLNEAHVKYDLDNFLHDDPTGTGFDEGKKGLYFSDIYRDVIENDSFEMFMMAPVNDFDGRFIGVISIEIEMELIYEFIQDTTGLDNTGETLIGKDIGVAALFLNRLRHDKDAALMREANYWEKAAFPIQEAVKGRSGSGLSIDYRGEEVIAAWRHIPSQNWGLVAKIDTEEAFASISKLKILLIILVGILTIIAFIVSLFFSKLFSRPIIRLTQRTKSIAAGDLRSDIKITSKDEIGQLANSFNTMVHSLKQAQEELVREEKFATIGRISGSIAHDVRHPLATIKNSAYFLNMTLKDPDEKTKKHLKLIDGEIARANEIIEGLMRLSKFKKIEKSRTNINDLVNEFISEFPLPKRIKLTTGLDNECTDIMVDGLQLRQVFANIASNAVHAIPEDGTLTVKTRRVLSSELGVQSEEGKDSKLKGDFVEISFENNGVSMKKETMERIFEPFFTTKSKGMGLGMSIVKKIIASNNGNISVESEEGKGSTFKIVFPAVRD